MKNRKILIVDDSEINRMLLSDILSDEFEVLEAQDGMEASVILNRDRHEISLVLLDLLMPVMDGFQLLEIMNKNGWIESLPVVMISSESTAAYVDKAYDLGVLDYISRPFNECMVKRRVDNIIMLAAKQKELSHIIANQVYENEKDSRLMVEILSNLMEFRNGESGLHVLHVRTLTELLLNQLVKRTDKYHLTQKDISTICNASALHDIGKIAVPDEILNKPGRLTNEEFAVMKTHAAAGADLLEKIPYRDNEPLIRYGREICRWHHERYDGRGYPDGLKGDEIPISAQIVALADVYDALTGKRVYKDAFSHEKAMQMILNGECGTFDPLLLQCLSDISEELADRFDEISLSSYSQNGILTTVQNILRSNDLISTEPAFQLLEQERTKNRFFSELSEEIRFEYRAMPEMISFSEWAAEFFGVKEVIVQPRQDKHWLEIFKKEDFEALLDLLKNTTPQQPKVEGRYLLTVKGEQRWYKVISRSLWSDADVPEYEGAIGKMVDITEEMQKMEQLETIATRDSLTGLLNHNAARAAISKILSERGERNYILLMIDMDNFKHVNDTYGHLFGDEILKFFAETMRRSTRSDDILARMGGDEFMIFMEYKLNPSAQVGRVFKRLNVDYKGFPIRISMGIADANDCGGDYETLFRLADDAMYSIKKGGKSDYRFYDESLKAVLEDKPSLTEIDSPQEGK